MKRLILIDSHAIIHRAYHALPALTTPGGDPIQAVYGFTSILIRIFKELSPDYIVAAFDLAGPTFRHVAYEHYKATRPETPSDLISQFSHVRDVVRAFGIPVLEKEGYEADDVIGTVATKCIKEKNLEVIVVTGDNDALQLVRPGLKVYSMRKGITDIIIYDEKAVKERFGFRPNQLIDFKGLKGDPSDNIKGVKGIGEKTAVELIQEFGSVEKIYAALKKGTKKISDSVKKKLEEGAEDAKISKELATIHTNVPVDFSLKESIVQKPDLRPEVGTILDTLGFGSLKKRIGYLPDTPKKEERGAQSGFSFGQDSGSLLNSSSTSIEKVSDDKGFQKLIESNQNKDTGLFLFEKSLFATFRGDKKVYAIDPSVLNSKSAKMFFKKRFFVYDGKAIIHFLAERGVGGLEIAFDILVASYIVGAFTRDFSFEAILSRELKQSINPIPQSFGEALFLVVELLNTKLSEGRMREVYDKIELPIIQVLARMEERGIRIDIGFLKRMSKEFNKKIEELKKTIYSLSGKEFNINSTQQLSVILFDTLQITAGGLRKTEKGGKISTRESELEKLRTLHPIVEKILSYRELVKLQNTYIDILPTLVNPKTGRIHTTYNQVGASTGRLSSQNPNLQNIPIMSEYGREIRKAFVAAPGYVLASFDYSQIELRVAAHMADDKKMIEAFQKGHDIHAITASEIYHVPLDKVTPEFRRAAKTLNFGILYGMGAQALSEGTGMKRDDARKFIDEYFKNFSGIAHFIQNTKEFVEENGYVETLFGRRRYIPEIHSQNWKLKREAERMAVNAPIQGTATGDIVKIAMIKVDEWAKKEKREDDVRMLLQVHDELLFEIREEYKEAGIKKVKELMESAVKLKVPLLVGVHTGKSWQK